MGLLDNFKHPELKNIQNLDAPETTLLHRRIIQSKPFLKKTYLDFYHALLREVPDASQKKCVELGSGGGFLKDVFPFVTTSDVIPLQGIDLCFSGLDMPFVDESVDVFFMMDVFHHVSDSELFLREINRCLKPGGLILMVEPANTLWGRFIYQNFHHELFDPTGDWKIKESGALSAANGALPWIVFKRDRQRFQRTFPGLKLTKIVPHAPLRYLVSGGFTLRQLLPNFFYGLICGVEWFLSPLHFLLGMFYTIRIDKINQEISG